MKKKFLHSYTIIRTYTIIWYLGLIFHWFPNFTKKTQEKPQEKPQEKLTS